MKNLMFLLLILVLMVVLVSGCRKRGCTDPDSTTYDQNAGRDDGSCRYEGVLVFWWKKSVYDSLVPPKYPWNDSAFSLSVYIDNEYEKRLSSMMMPTHSPAFCREWYYFPIIKDLGNKKTKSFSYSIKDKNGSEYWSGTVILDGSTCITEELIL